MCSKYHTYPMVYTKPVESSSYISIEVNEAKTPDFCMSFGMICYDSYPFPRIIASLPRIWIQFIQSRLQTMKSYFKHLNWIVCLTSLIVGLGLTEISAESSQPNTLSQEERAEGWELLWDGHSFDGWRAIYKSDIPKTGWIIENNSLICLGEELPREQRGGGILTDRKYKSFELRFEFKLSENGNSGIKYFVDVRL